ncbi:MAG: hypothetical protein AABY51_10535 [Deltaproteobacteria bacterium]
MKILKCYLFCIVISSEFLVLLIGVFLFTQQELIGFLSSKISDNSELLKYVALLPATLVVYVFKESKTLLFPKDDEKKVLQGWQDYWKLKIRFNIGLLYSITFAFIGVTALIFGFKINEPVGFTLVLISVAGGLIVVAHIYFAIIKLSEIFRCKS